MWGAWQLKHPGIHLQVDRTPLPVIFSPFFHLPSGLRPCFSCTKRTHNLSQSTEPQSHKVTTQSARLVVRSCAGEDWVQNITSLVSLESLDMVTRPKLLKMPSWSLKSAQGSLRGVLWPASGFKAHSLPERSIYIYIYSLYLRLSPHNLQLNL